MTRNMDGSVEIAQCILLLKENIDLLYVRLTADMGSQQTLVWGTVTVWVCTGHIYESIVFCRSLRLGAFTQ
jgi:hypothetical protein